MEKEARSDDLIRRAHRENALLPYCLFVSTTDTTRSAMIPHDLLTATQPVSQPPLSQEESAAGVWTLWPSLCMHCLLMAGLASRLARTPLSVCPSRMPDEFCERRGGTERTNRIGSEGTDCLPRCLHVRPPDFHPAVRACGRGRGDDILIKNCVCWLCTLPSQGPVHNLRPQPVGAFECWQKERPQPFNVGTRKKRNLSILEHGKTPAAFECWNKEKEEPALQCWNKEKTPAFQCWNKEKEKPFSIITEKDTSLSMCEQGKNTSLSMLGQGNGGREKRQLFSVVLHDYVLCFALIPSTGLVTRLATITNDKLL